MSIIASRDWVYEHLVCEFDHWDVCLAGLIERGGERWWCSVAEPYADEVIYQLLPIAWDAECEEYLADYRVAYRHWFHEGKPRPAAVPGQSCGWFYEKWENRNPIRERVQRED